MKNRNLLLLFCLSEVCLNEEFLKILNFYNGGTLELINSKGKDLQIFCLNK